MILRPKSYLRIKRGDSFKFDLPMIKRIVNVGIPAMIEQLLMRAGMIIFSKTVAGLGTVAFATHQVCMNIQALSFIEWPGLCHLCHQPDGPKLGEKAPRPGAGHLPPGKAPRHDGLPVPGCGLLLLWRSHRGVVQRRPDDRGGRRQDADDRGHYPAAPVQPVHPGRCAARRRRYPCHRLHHLPHRFGRPPFAGHLPHQLDEYGPTGCLGGHRCGHS